MRKVVVTGGAGFIGSNIVSRLLLQKVQVVCFDNFSTGNIIFLQKHRKNPNLQVVNGDLRDTTLLNKSLKNTDLVFHLAAHADIRSGVSDRFIDHEQNLEMTHNVLESMVKNNVPEIVFSSTSAVYGDPDVHPTPEDTALRPTSLYGATKAACESYIHAYSSYFGFRSHIFRFVSFLGEHYTHGIIFDVLKKLKKDKKIDLLSDGSPKKSSLYVGDGINAIFIALEKSKERFNIYNLGHDRYLSVSEIANQIIASSSHTEVEINWLGKESNWKGDNQFVHLDTSKIKSLGWSPSLPIEKGIAKTVRYLESRPMLFSRE